MAEKPDQFDNTQDTSMARLDRRQASYAVAGTLAGLVVPQSAQAQGLAGLRKRITGEVDGEERSAVRRKKDAQFNACEMYQCIEPNQNTMGGTLARTQIGSLSLLTPTKWTKADGNGDMLASWTDGAGASVTVMKQTVADSGIAWKRIPAGTIPAMAKSILDYDLVQTGSKLAKLKGDGAEYTGGKARYITSDGVVMYTIGLRTETEIDVVDVLLTDDVIYKISVAAPIDKWQAVKGFLSEILASPSLPKATA